MDWKQFQLYAQAIMSEFFGISLNEGKPANSPKKFDLVSQDQQIVGDAKYLTLVQGHKIPPAKFMEIAGHVWLLENVPAQRRFLVFGNDCRVPELWLKRYGQLVKSVEFYFLPLNSRIKKLN